MNELPYLQSSSSSNVVAQSKNTGETIRGDTGGENTKKRGRKKQQDSVPMIVENIAENQKRKKIIEDTGGENTKKKGRKTNAEREKRKAEGNEPPKKKQNKQEKELMRIQDAEEKAIAKEAVGEAKAAAKEAKKEEKAEARKEHGVEKILGKDKKWWERQNITILKQQAELRGYRFTDIETKFKKFKKPDYLKVLLNKLNL